MSKMKREITFAIRNNIPTSRDLEIRKYAIVEAFHYKAKPKELKKKVTPDKIVPPIQPQELSKNGIRQAFQQCMLEYRLGYGNVKEINFFKGAQKASHKVPQKGIFINAEVVWADSDKVLKDIRFHSLQAKKTLLMRPLTFEESVASRVVHTGTKDLYRSSLKRTGDQNLPLAQPVHIDACFVGSVAVSRTGRRVGVEKGSLNLKYAMLGSAGLIDAEVPVITIVHDCQVIDLPEEIFTARDVNVDYIATPTRWIPCPRRNNPPLVQWNELNQADLNAAPVLIAIQQMQLAAGVDGVMADANQQ